MALILNTPTTAWSKYTVVLDEDTFIFEFQWSEREECWTLTIHDVNENVVMQGVKLIQWQPIILHHPQTNLPKGEIVVVDSENEFGKGNVRIGRDDFGTRFFLVYYTKTEVGK